MTPDIHIAEMVEAMLQRNENFRGTTVDSEKIEKFTTLRTKADELAHLVRGTLKVSPPDNTKRNAMLMIDFALPVAIFNESVRKRLAELIVAADDVSFAAKDSVLRLSLGVHGIWKE